MKQKVKTYSLDSLTLAISSPDELHTKVKEVDKKAEVKTMSNTYDVSVAVNDLIDGAKINEIEFKSSLGPRSIILLNTNSKGVKKEFELTIEEVK